MFPFPLLRPHIGCDRSAPRYKHRMTYPSLHAQDHLENGGTGKTGTDIRPDE